MGRTSRNFLLGALGLAGAACSLLSDFRGFVPYEANDASVPERDAGASLKSGPWEACRKTVTKPLTTTGGVSLPVVSFAMFKLALPGDSLENAPIADGVNLDRVISQPNAKGEVPQSCVLPPNSNGGVDIQDGGIDNTSGTLVVSSSASSTVQERVANGETTFVLQIANFAGSANALNVDVTIGDTQSFVKGANGALRPFADAGASADAGADAGSRSPLDTWYVPNETRADDAWVSQSVLVAHFPVLRLPIAVAPGQVAHSAFHFPVTDAYVVACLGDDIRTQDRLSVSIVGRLKSSDFFAETGGVPGDNGKLSCERSDWSQIKSLICRQRDIRAFEKEDQQGKPCDSMSVSLNFDLYRVQTISQGFTPTKPWIEFDAGACRSVSSCDDELDAGAP